MRLYNAVASSTGARWDAQAAAKDRLREQLAASSSARKLQEQVDSGADLIAMGESARALLVEGKSEELLELLSKIPTKRYPKEFDALKALAHVVSAAKHPDSADAASRKQHRDKILKYGADANQLMTYTVSILRDPGAEVGVLFELGADLNVPGQQQSVLGIMARGNQLWSLDIALKNGSDPNLLDRQGLSGFHYAVLGRHIGPIEAMLKFGADPELPLPDGRKLITLFERYAPRDRETYKLLTNASASSSSKDEGA
jgi:hypothetical protein